MTKSREISEEEYLRLMLYLPDKIRKCIDALASDHFSDPDMKPYFVSYITRLHTLDGATQKDLKAVIPFDKSRISVVIHQLIDKGYVYNDGEGRNSSLHLTEKGEAAYPSCCSFLQRLSEELFRISPCDPKVRQANIDFDAHMDGLLEKYRQ